MGPSSRSTLGLPVNARNFNGINIIWKSCKERSKLQSSFKHYIGLEHLHSIKMKSFVLILLTASLMLSVVSVNGAAGKLKIAVMIRSRFGLFGSF